MSKALEVGAHDGRPRLLECFSALRSLETLHQMRPQCLCQFSGNGLRESFHKDLDLREPETTETLVTLEAEGWISHAGTHEGIDHWSIAPRALDRTALDALRQQECVTKPAHIEVVYWPEIRIRRDLARVSCYVSSHRETDVTETRAPHQEIYRYDVEHECEIAPDRSIRILEPTHPDESNAVRQRRSARAPRPWPRAPSKGTPIEMDDQEGRVAQHLWINHVPIKKIAAQLRLSSSIVQGYLAALADPRHPLPPVGAAL